MARSYFFLGFFSAFASSSLGQMKEAALLARPRTIGCPRLTGRWRCETALRLGLCGREQEFKRALQLDPNSADTLHDFAHYLMAMAEWMNLPPSRRAVTSIRSMMA